MQILKEQKLDKMQNSHSLHCDFFVSDDPEKFQILGSEILGYAIKNTQVINNEVHSKIGFELVVSQD